MSARRFALYPFVAGAYLVLVEWSTRTGVTARATTDLMGSLALALAMALAGWWVARPLTNDRDRRALASLVWVLWAALFLSFQLRVFDPLAGARGTALGAALAWTGLAAALTWLVTRGVRPLGAITRALDTASVVLLAFGLSGLALGGGPEGHDAERRPERTVVVPRGPDRPDIYVLVLDKYSSGAWLEASYGLDHRPFEDSLRALGFAVPRQATAPYAHTMLSMTSFLEGAYLHPAERELTWGWLHERVEKAAVWSRLQALGYRYAFFPTTLGATRRSTPADLVLKAPAGALATPGETWWVNSPFLVLGRLTCRVTICEPTLTPYVAEHGEELAWKLRTLATLPDSEGPIVAFAHLLTPHEPFLFEDDCSPGRPWWPASDADPAMDERVRAAYAHQVRCLDAMLLETVTRIVARSAVPPVIILQGDHGHGRITTDMLRNRTLELDEMPPEKLAERMTVFAAYRFPGAPALVPDDASPVNALRAALGPVLGDTGTMLPARAFWSSYQRAFAFTEVAPARLRPGVARDSASSP